MKTIEMEHSKYRIEFPNEDSIEGYRIIKGDEDITGLADNNVVLDLVIEIRKMEEENEKLQGIIEDMIKRRLKKEYY